MKYEDKNGRKRCHGSSELKSTQSYSMNFGAAHALAYHEFVITHLGHHFRDAPGVPIDMETLAMVDENLDLPDSFDDILKGEPDKWHNNKSGERKLTLKAIR